MKIKNIDGINITISMDDGTEKIYTISHFNFTPEVGDEVKIADSGFSSIVSKVYKDTYEDDIDLGFGTPKKTKPQNKARTLPKENSRSYTKQDTTYTKQDTTYSQKQSYKTYSDYDVPKGKHIVNKWIYIILAFLFGGLGIHRFYARKFAGGITMVILSTIALGSIVFSAIEPDGVVVFMPFVFYFIIFANVIGDIIRAVAAKSDAKGNIII
jgi:TM2 domain-containing membrane protein YozV